MLRERIMLGLRLDGGFDLDAAARELGVDAWTSERVREIERLARLGRVERDRGVLRIPRCAWLFADDKAARLF